MYFGFSMAVYFFLRPAFTRYSRWQTGVIMDPDISKNICVWKISAKANIWLKADLKSF